MRLASRPKWMVTVITLVASLSLFLMPVSRVALAAPPTSSAGTVSIQVAKDDKELLELLSAVRELIRRYYTKDVDPSRIYEGALRGVVDALNDPYSQYMTEEQFQSFSSSLEGEYSGIGVTIELLSGTITVVSVFAGSPAERAGMRPGDAIVSGDGTDLRGKTTADAAAVLRGPAGTSVRVTVRRPSSGETLTFTMVRQTLRQDTISLKDYGEGVYCIGLSQFTTDTSRQFPVIMKYLRSRGLKGLILDLRNNPGGYLDSCLEIAKELVPKGPIVELRRKDKKQVLQNDRDTVPVPTIVLVNKGSASASEILAGAIRDRGVGILVGEPTFGKACVQSIVPLGGSLGGIRLTVADYYTPSGESLAGSGLTPAVVLKPEQTPSPQAVVLERPLTRGDVGLDVLAVQETLQFLGFQTSKPDGVFGPSTLDALDRFMKARGLQPDLETGSRLAEELNLAVVDSIRSRPDTVLETGKDLLLHKIQTGWWR